MWFQQEGKGSTRTRVCAVSFFRVETPCLIPTLSRTLTRFCGTTFLKTASFVHCNFYSQSYSSYISRSPYLEKLVKECSHQLKLELKVIFKTFLLHKQNHCFSTTVEVKQIEIAGSLATSQDFLVKISFDGFAPLPYSPGPRRRHVGVMVCNRSCPCSDS